MRERPEWDKGCPTCKHGGPERIAKGMWFDQMPWDCALGVNADCIPPIGGPRNNMRAGKYWEDGGHA